MRRLIGGALLLLLAGCGGRAPAWDAGFCRDGTATFSAERSRTIRLTRE